MTVLMPICRSSAKRSRMPPLTMSRNSTTPSTRLPSATASGVAPPRATVSTSCVIATGHAPPSASTNLRTASAAPLRRRRPSRSTPLMRVCAEKRWNSCVHSARSRPRSWKRCFASTTMERPSGVSSANDASCATSASSCSFTPGAAWNAEACRSPSVIVPVLSSSNTFTSPAASTARPDVAITFERTMRSMPAMPIADSRPPIVVGIRHTSSATSTTEVMTVPVPDTVTA